MKHLAILITITLLYTAFGYGQSCSCVSGACSITASIAYGSDIAAGKYSVFYGSTGPANVLDKPIIILEPLDFTDTATCFSFYNNYYSNTLISELQSLGYDVIYLDFNHNLDYIEANAMLTVELIKTINQTKVGNEKLIVVGENTSALTARYALTYMEQHNMDHQTQAYISIDGAHRGLNFPLGLQIFLQEMDNALLLYPYSLEIINRLSQPVFKETLIYSLSGYSSSHLFPGSLFTQFFDSLHALNSCYGYPTQCKKIAFTNGSVHGQVQTDNNGFNAYGNEEFISFDNGDYTFEELAGGIYSVPFNWTQFYDTFLVYSPGFDTTTLTQLDISWNEDWFTSWTHHYVSKSATHQSAVDFCPGSYSTYIYDFANILYSYADVTVPFQRPTFIPTISALDINTNNYLFDFSSHSPIESITAFDKVYSPYSATGFDWNYEYDDLSEAFGGTNLTDMFSYIYNGVGYNSCTQADLNISGDTVSTGNFLNESVSDKITTSDFVVDSAASAALHAANSITLNPGTIFKYGSTAEISILPCASNQCVPTAFKTNPTISDNGSNSYTTIHIDSSTFSIFPNPASANFTVCIYSEINNWIISIYDLNGKTVKQIPLYSHEIIMSTDYLPDGMYTVTLSNNSTYISKSLVVSKK